MAKKGRYKIVGMVSELTGHRRITRKKVSGVTKTDGANLVSGKLQYRKYDPLVRKVALYKETSKNLGRNEV